MPWEPVQNVFDASPAIDNIFGFISTHQRDALDWAQADPQLPVVAKFYNSVRNVTVFPAITVLSTSEADTWEDIIESGFSITLAVDLRGGDQDQVVKDSKKYALALKSMLANMAETTLFQNSIIKIVATIERLEVEYDFVGKEKNKFIQSFILRATYSCNSSAR